MYDHNIKFLPPKKANDPGATFTVPERIYEETTSASGKTSRKLIYAKGDRIRPSEARRLGLVP